MLEKIAKKNNIVTNEDIKDRIAYLETLKEHQEEVLKLNLVEVHKSLQPVELIKTAIDNIRGDDEVLEKTGGYIGGLGLNYVVGKIFKNRDNTIGGHVKAFVIQQVASFLYKKNEKRITHFVGNLTRKALRKLHVVEDEVPLQRLREEEARLREVEEEEDKELSQATTRKLSDAKEKPLYEKDDPRVAEQIDEKKVEKKKEELDEEEEK